MTTSDDQLRLLRTVFTDDSPLDESSRDYVQHLMGQVESDQSWGVPAADSDDPDDAYVKNGWLPLSTGWAINSVGSVRYRGHTVLIAVLSDHRSSMPAAVDVVEDVARAGSKAVTGR